MKILIKMSMTAVLFAAVSFCAAQQKAAEDPWKPMRFFLGEWQGTSRGKPGSGVVDRAYSLALNGKFIEVRNTSVWKPTAENPKGEKHEDHGFFSYDRARKKFVLRQFHVEGFVNQYVQEESAAPNQMVFTSEAIENIPSGWRAREIYTIVNDNEMMERFELAEPGKEFQAYSESKLKRKK